jgi:hypothetical protein
LGGIKHWSDFLTLARVGFTKHNCSLPLSCCHPGFCKIGRNLCSTSGNSFGPCRSAKSRVPNITALSQSLEVVISGTPCSLGVTLHFIDLTHQFVFGLWFLRPTLDEGPGSNFLGSLVFSLVKNNVQFYNTFNLRICSGHIFFSGVGWVSPQCAH